MSQIAAYLSFLCLLPVIACDPGGQAAAEAAAHPAGLASAAALVDAPPETIPTVIRRVWGGPRADFDVSPSPDGRFVSLTDWDTGDLAVRNLETGETRRITNNPAPYDPGYAAYPRVSPDGKQIAYHWWNEERRLFELRVVDWNGSDPRVLLEIDWEIRPYGWSRDGRFILAARMGTEVDPPELVKVATADGSLTVLQTVGASFPRHAEFSPDGRFVAYDRSSEEHADQRDIFVLTVAGRRETLIVDEASHDYLLGWAPDGGHILFSSDRTGTPGVWLLPVNDGRAAGAPELVLPDAWGVAPVGFLSDGRYFYGVQTGTRDVYVATLSADQRSVATPPSPATPRRLGSNTCPAWSPDGRHLAYIRRVHALHGAGSSLVIRSMESGEVRELHLGDGIRPWAAPRWAPDGRSLVLMAGDGIAPNGVYRVDVQSGRTELLVSERMVYPGQGIDLSPDGRFLYYRSWVEDEHSRRILRKDLDSGSVEEVYVAPSGWIWNLALSPDGSSLAVSLAVMAEEGPEVFVLPAAGGTARGLTPPVSRTGARSITWMPDGKAILYSRWREVSRVSVAGGEPESIGLQMELINTVSLHPDGRRIALSAGRPASELWVMEDFLPGHRTGNDDNGQN